MMCQSEIEGGVQCDKQCDHCAKYYYRKVYWIDTDCNCVTYSNYFDLNKNIETYNSFKEAEKQL